MKLVTLPVQEEQPPVQILIHTSVKLVTTVKCTLAIYDIILIHTSVKLVTREGGAKLMPDFILIHTSVKLVTTRSFSPQ